MRAHAPMRQSRAGSGIGRALRKARLRRGKSLEEAARETRVKAEYLQALELEHFDVLLGDVYVRGFLRSYSRYLGLNPEKVVAFYERAFGRAKPAPTPVHRAPGMAVESVVEIPEHRKRSAWVLAAVATIIVLMSAGAIGLLRKEASTPTPASSAAAPLADAAESGSVTVDLLPEEPTNAVVVVDDEVQPRISGPLQPGEAYSFRGKHRVLITLQPGYTVVLTVNGKKLGKPGLPGQIYEHEFTPADFLGDGSQANG